MPTYHCEIRQLMKNSTVQLLNHIILILLLAICMSIYIRLVMYVSISLYPPLPKLEDPETPVTEKWWPSKSKCRGSAWDTIHLQQAELLFRKRRLELIYLQMHHILPFISYVLNFFTLSFYELLLVSFCFQGGFSVSSCFLFSSSITFALCFKTPVFPLNKW